MIARRDVARYRREGGMTSRAFFKRASPLRLQDNRIRHSVAIILAVVFMGAAPTSARAADPKGQLTVGVTASIAPTWFDPAESPGLITPYVVLYALHDAMLKAMPG